MTDNAEKLFNDNIGLSNFAVTTYKYYIAGYDFDDLLQLARLTLWQAALDYDPSRGVEFSAYAVRSIHNELVKLIIKDQCSKRSKYTEVLAGAILIDDSDGYLLTEAKPSIDNVENEVECRVMLDAVLRSLDKESLYIIREIYINGRTQTSLAKELHISTTYMNHKLKQIADKAKHICCC